MLKYRIYPSLLDSFSSYLRADEEAESFFNIDNETGEYKKPPEQIESELKQSLIDSINRVPFSSEAADKGTAFNALVDSFIHRQKHIPTDREPYIIEGNEMGNMVKVTFPATELADERVFKFDREWVIEQAKYFTGSISQLFVSAVLETRYGEVELYGYIDELRKDEVFDIKTTSYYQFGKYEKKWQRHVYPYCLIESGQMDNISAFEYTIFVLRGGTSRTPLISGVRNPEYYTYNHAQTKKMLTAHVELFIEFLEANRALITDKKIFNEL